MFLVFWSLTSPLRLGGLTGEPHSGGGGGLKKGLSRRPTPPSPRAVVPQPWVVSRKAPPTPTPLPSWLTKWQHCTLFRIDAVRQQLKMKGFKEDQIRETLSTYEAVNVWMVCPACSTSLLSLHLCMCCAVWLCPPLAMQDLGLISAPPHCVGGFYRIGGTFVELETPAAPQNCHLQMKYPMQSMF